MTKNQNTAAIMKEFLQYEAATGKLYWKPRDLKWFKDGRSQSIWNARYAGKEAFTATGNHGYKIGRVLNKGYLAHRVIIAIIFGDWPQHMVDHIDGDRTNNKINNLRQSSPSENAANRGIQSNNSSGVKGIFWNKRRSKWQAAISFNGSKKHLGTFDTIDSAKSTYISASLSVHGEFARGS